MRLAAWFVAHEAFDVLQEIDKILRVSGSPYDWGLYDKRALDVVGEDEVDPSTFKIRISAGLVDFAEAKAEVMVWKDMPEYSRDEEQRPHGLWLEIPNNEYMFGRFGFDDEKSAASPADGELLGPHSDDERLFQEADFAALLRRNAHNLGFVDPWRDRVEFLLNELLLSYLEPYINPLGRSFDTVLTAAEALTPQRAPQRDESRTLDSYLFQYLTQPHADPIPDWDAAAIAARVRAFLFSRSGEQRGLFSNNEYIAGLCRGLAFLIGEVLEIASNGAKDSCRSKIVPADVRIAVRNDAELSSVFKYSRVYWDGTE
ncbi:MAG: hypothetical protein Q9208_005355 [Pyrenodesmia sp. 3 TL-2023]